MDDNINNSSNNKENKMSKVCEYYTRRQQGSEWVICCRETGDYIDTFNSKEEAENMLLVYEDGDKIEDIYEPNFYEIRQSKG